MKQKYKKRLMGLAKRTGKVAKRAGSAYMDASEAAVRKLQEQAQSDEEQARGLLERDDTGPNDRADVELYQRVRRNHDEVTRMLRDLQSSVDDLERPMDGGGKTMMGEAGSSGPGMGSDFGFGGLGAPDGEEDEDDFDWTRGL